MNPKQVAAERACAFISDGMMVGLGSGSTAALAVRHLGERIAKERISVTGVATSVETERIAREVGVPLVSVDDVVALDVTIDGADEVDPALDLVKGLGGALVREKVVAALTKRQVIVVDPSKMVDRLGTRSPLPVEVVPFAEAVVARRVANELGAKPVTRVKDGRTFITDNGNPILDLHFADGIVDARALELALHAIPGVVDTGLFLGMTSDVIIGEADGTARHIPRG